MTRDEALQKCVSLNGELLSIHSFEEQNFITALMMNKSPAWIGFERAELGNKWTWSDQSRVTFTNWAISHSEDFLRSDNCVYLLSSEIQAGNWVSSSCTSKNISVICQMDKSMFSNIAHTFRYFFSYSNLVLE